MRVHNPVGDAAGLSGVPNLPHLLTVYNVRKTLVDTKCRRYVSEILSSIPDSSSVDIDYLNAKSIADPQSVCDILFHTESALHIRYDLIIVHYKSVHRFVPILYRGVFLFVVAGEAREAIDLLPYVKMNEAVTGTFYLNDMHSLCLAPTVDKIGVYEKSFVRYLPHRFMRNAVCLARRLLPDLATVVEPLGVPVRAVLDQTFDHR
ncbi:uncharacterized protein EV422DRAFT_73545 [Fimicolochytrium jonesii]|uniref:uncharacterized protein n=1 Tax=Fimicolochytrium jonesii TaxID=1396493 RepID=UPI0022FDBEC1|nr:uncharacterized protein EV422DRAFT_73545 [Fimicolochytrium jonesii]KAI8820500.1 hypothetical protein EV422DRAFT_73545 [Fimicolochytrium jonesii]